MGGLIDLQPGTPYGKLTVLGRAPNKHGQTYFFCLCQCGETVEVNSVILRSGRKTHCGCQRKPAPSTRGSSHGRRSRSFRYGSYTTGRQGLTESRNIDLSKPAFGSVQVGEGKFYWCAFKHLSDWLEGGEPIESGYLANEQRAHDTARAAVRFRLNDREQLAPMPESWVESLHRRIIEGPIVLEQAARYVALPEREDGTVAGYDWEEVCETNDYDVIDFYADPEEDDTEAQDMDVDEAA